MNSTRLYWYLAALGCAIAISAGQLLFKMAANRLHGPSLLTPEAIPILFLSLLIYGAATIAWVLVLRQVHLSSAYPFMAISFILVPLGSHIFLKEPIPLQYWGGVALLITGLFLIGRSLSEG